MTGLPAAGRTRYGRPPARRLPEVIGWRVAMLTYVYFGTNNLEAATAFYTAALAPLGMTRCVTNDPVCESVADGWGLYEVGGARELAFWIGKPFDQKPASVGNG